MNPFWASFFDHLKGCGRNAAIFLITLGVLFGLVISAGILGGNDSHNANDFIAALLGGCVLILLAVVGVAFRRAWQEYRGGRCGTLSSDELCRARSKLRNGLQGFKSVKPVERPPDTDLRMN